MAKKEKRDFVVVIQLSASEKAAVKLKAKMEGLSVSSYVRQLIKRDAAQQKGAA